MLYVAIDQLPPQTRNVILLNLEGKTNPEVAGRIRYFREHGEVFEKVGLRDIKRDPIQKLLCDFDVPVRGVNVKSFLF